MATAALMLGGGIVLFSALVVLITRALRSASLKK